MMISGKKLGALLAHEEEIEDPIPVADGEETEDREELQRIVDAVLARLDEGKGEERWLKWAKTYKGSAKPRWARSRDVWDRAVEIVTPEKGDMTVEHWVVVAHLYADLGGLVAES